MGNNRLVFFVMMMSIWIKDAISLRCYTDLEATQVSFLNLGVPSVLVYLKKEGTKVIIVVWYITDHCLPVD